MPMKKRRVFVSVGPRGARVRDYTKFAVDAPPSEIRAWREQRRTELRAESPEPPQAFAADAQTYLDAVTALPTYKERVRDINLWVVEFGTIKRDKITSVMIRSVRDRWLTVGPRHVQRWVMHAETGKKVRQDDLVEGPLSASTVNHRLRALENLWTVLDGRHADNPVREVPEADEPDPPPRAIPPAILANILCAMRDSATKARLQVMAATGLPHATLMRVTTEGFDAKAKTVWVPGRQKGKGTSGRLIPLTTAAVAALKEMRRWEAWGSFSTASMQKVWDVACAKAGVTGTRPYDVRHSYGTAALAATGDLRATQMLMGHSTPGLTERYARQAVNPALAAAVAKIQAAGKPARTKKAVNGKGKKRGRKPRKAR